MTEQEQRTGLQSLYFSHTTYDKLKDIDVKNPITLLETFIKTDSNLSDAFVEYDTTYHNGGGKKYNFQLHKGSNIILLFKDKNGSLFTTIRSNSAKKLSYYNAMRGREFFIEFREFDEPNDNTIDRHIPKINRSFILH